MELVSPKAIFEPSTEPSSVITDGLLSLASTDIMTPLDRKKAAAITSSKLIADIRASFPTMVTCVVVKVDGKLVVRLGGNIGPGEGAPTEWQNRILEEFGARIPKGLTVNVFHCVYMH